MSDEEVREPYRVDRSKGTVARNDVSLMVRPGNLPVHSSGDMDK